MVTILKMLEDEDHHSSHQKPLSAHHHNLQQNARFHKNDPSPLCLLFRILQLVAIATAWRMCLKLVFVKLKLVRSEHCSLATKVSL
jgi:hypothetical protein